MLPQEQLDKATYDLNFFTLSTSDDFTAHQRCLGQTTDGEGLYPKLHTVYTVYTLMCIAVSGKVQFHC